MSTTEHTTLHPVLLALRIGLQVLFVGLLALALTMTLRDGGPERAAVCTVGAIMALTWVGGVVIHRARDPRTRRRIRWAWIALLALEWSVLVWLSAHAAYLAFPLFFLLIDAFGTALGIVAVALSTSAAVWSIGSHLGWTAGGVIGPVVGAVVAVLISLAYRALLREAAEHERLYRELLDAQHALAASERAAGVSSERERLARDIHDTIAQSLSSIQLLLHAAERSAPDGPGSAHLTLARETAAAALADARRFIQELTPDDLERHGLAAALRDLAERTGAAAGLQISVRVADRIDLPMSQQTALLRIAQGAVANVAAHAQADTAVLEVTVDADEVCLEVQDDGIGFDPGAVVADPKPTSFGLRSIRERAEQYGGELTVRSRPGEGTVLRVTLPRSTVARTGPPDTEEPA